MPAQHPPPAASGVPYAKLWRWGWFVVRDALGWFSINTALTLLVQTLVQVNVQVLALLISALTSTAKIEAGEHGLRAILHSPRGLGITFAVLAVIIVVLGYGDRLLTAWTDNVMTGRLQRRLHDKLLTLGPSYHRNHDVGLTTQLVMSAGGTQMVLRDVISAPLTRGVGLLTALYFLQSNLQSIHDTGWPLRFALILSLVLLPIVGARLVARTRKVMTRARDADLAVASEFGNSASMPLEGISAWCW